METSFEIGLFHKPTKNVSQAAEVVEMTTRNHFISNLVLDSLEFKKLLEVHVFYKKPLYKQRSTGQPKM